ncbi:hypothetical protein [Prevotella sp. oral taxon 820]|uniref:hypothetical protein n=1 Tax=Prevotella sp. oral taxon 820 TaxID=2081962 RepID=UPI0013049493|nr:hypothetical protein [Prevotella sp. oral taxon 820]
MGETTKMRKTVFRPWRKQQKCKKQCFGHGRNNKNAKNSISAMGETTKMRKTVFPPWGKNHLASFFIYVLMSLCQKRE